MKPKRAVSAYVLLIGIMGLSIVGGIIAFQIFVSVTKSQLTAEQNILIKPIDGSIDTEIINGLRNRRKFSESELNTITEKTITTIPSEITSAGGNIKVAPTNEATSSATTN